MTGRQIPLRDAAYTLKTGLKLFSRRTSPAALQKDKQYKEFIRHNEAEGWNNERLSGEKQRVYAVATDEGVLFFSDGEKGMKARNSYLQHLANGFFNMTKGAETLKLYEIETPSRQVAELADNCIDKLAKSDLHSAGTQLNKSEFSFTPEKLAGKEMLEGAVCTDKYDLRPDYNNFDRLTKDFNLGISPRNYDVASLLYISENGYAGHVAADYFIRSVTNMSSGTWLKSWVTVSRHGNRHRCRHMISAMRPCRWKRKQWQGIFCNRSSI